MNGQFNEAKEQIRGSIKATKKSFLLYDGHSFLSPSSSTMEDAIGRHATDRPTYDPTNDRPTPSSRYLPLRFATERTKKQKTNKPRQGRQRKARQDKARQDKARQRKATQGESSSGKARQGPDNTKSRQGKARQGKARQKPDSAAIAAANKQKTEDPFLPP